MTKIFEKHPTPWLLDPDTQIVDTHGSIVDPGDQTFRFMVSCVNWYATYGSGSDDPGAVSIENNELRAQLDDANHELAKTKLLLSPTRAEAEKWQEEAMRLSRELGVTRSNLKTQQVERGEACRRGDELHDALANALDCDVEMGDAELVTQIQELARRGREAPDETANCQARYIGHVQFTTRLASLEKRVCGRCAAVLEHDLVGKLRSDKSACGDTAKDAPYDEYDQSLTKGDFDLLVERKVTEVIRRLGIKP